MSLTRKYLKELGIESDKIDLIIEAHSETVDGLKADRDTYKEMADKATTLESELTTLKAQSNTDAELKAKYDALVSEFDTYKADIQAKDLLNTKSNAYKSLLKEAGVSDKRLDTILKVTDLANITLDDEGNITDKDALADKVKEEWADFIESTSTEGASTDTPPTNTGNATYTMADLGTMTRDQINANWDSIKSSLSAN